MGKRTSYPHGTFSWAENSSTDQDAAKAFYATVLGWEYEDSPVGDGIVYSMAKVGDSYVGAVSPQMQAEREQGVPSHWNNYVTVDSADDVAGRVAELGGQLLAPPFDVMDVGRMAVLMDPGGAALCLWEPRRHIGAGLVNAPGALCWNELATRDPERAKNFYAELFGWTFRDFESDSPYWVIMAGERSNGGVRLLGDEMPADVPEHWLPYFAVEDVDAASATVATAGGTVMVPKTKIGDIAAFAGVQDPAGAMFCLYEGRLED